MSRPNSVHDLHSYEKSPVELVRVNAEVLDMHPRAAAKIYAAFSEIMEEDYDFSVSVQNGHLVRGRSDSELVTALKHQQRLWDDGKADYERWCDEGVYPKYTYSLSAYCRAEGIDVPDSPEAE